jgi:hypothetical protein
VTLVGLTNRKVLETHAPDVSLIPLLLWRYLTMTLVFLGPLIHPNVVFINSLLNLWKKSLGTSIGA